jgi:hypothetical protein
MIIGFVGFIGSGKDTAADYLVNYHGFRRDSFANTLKDAVACVFGWDRVLLEGRTKEAREWREKQDNWWTNRLGIAITPRWVLQNWGTEVCRKGFHDDIWIASLENKLRNSTDDIVISDVRFPNEIRAIHNAGGSVIRVRRGEEPEWFDAALSYNRGERGNMSWAVSRAKLDKLKIHASEYSWVGGKIDRVVANDGTIDELYTQIKNLALDPPVSTANLTHEAVVDNWHKLI